MIIPSGKKRDQVNQGLSKNSSFGSIFDSVIFKQSGLEKLAIATVDEPKQENPDLTNVVQQSNNSRISGNVPPQMGETENVPQMPSDKSIQPTNRSMMQNQSGGSSPASKFLRNDGKPNIAVENIIASETEKVRKFIGTDFHLSISQGKDGSIQCKIAPPTGGTINDPDNFVKELMHYVGGQFVSLDTPSSHQGGPIMVNYKPAGMQQKVQKR